MNYLRNVLAVAGCALGVLAAAPGHAVPVPYSTTTIVDGASANLLLEVTNANLGSAGSSILDVNITIDFAKCASMAVIPAAVNDLCAGPAYAQDITFRLTSPTGTSVDLALFDTTWFPGTDGPASGARIRITFSDDPVSSGDPAPGSIDPAAFQSGTFLPTSGFMSDFIGQSALGFWELFIDDFAEPAPLALVGFTLDITVADAAAPAPATALLLGLGLAGVAASRRKPH